MIRCADGDPRRVPRAGERFDVLVSRASGALHHVRHGIASDPDQPAPRSPHSRLRPVLEMLVIMSDTLNGRRECRREGELFHFLPTLSPSPHTSAHDPFPSSSSRDLLGSSSLPIIIILSSAGECPDIPGSAKRGAHGVVDRAPRSTGRRGRSRDSKRTGLSGNGRDRNEPSGSPVGKAARPRVLIACGQPGWDARRSAAQCRTIIFSTTRSPAAVVIVQK